MDHGIKDGTYVRVQVKQKKQTNQMEHFTYKDNKYEYRYEFINDLILNGKYQEKKVNYIECTQIELKSKKQKFYR